MKKSFICLALAAFSGMAILAGCSSKGVNPVTPPPANTVSIQNFAFMPDTIRVTAGSTVTWTNSDSTPHTVTDLSNAFDSGSLASAQNYQHTFATAGTFTYHCTIHTMMKSAVVIVK